MALITEIDYRILGYYRKDTRDTNGDLITREYYENYNNGSYENLRVKETNTITRNAVTGIPEQRLTIIEWISGAEVIHTKTITKLYDVISGMYFNSKSREALILTAQQYIVNDFVTRFGAAGMNNAKAFLNSVSPERSTYIAGDIDPLIQAIQNTTDPNVSAENKTELDTILNITY